MPYKVLLVHHGGGIGGAPVSMLQLAMGLDRSLFSPVAIFTHPGPVLDFAKEMGIPSRVVPLRSAFFYSAHVPIRLRMLIPFIMHFRSSTRAMEQLVREEQPDIVHLNTSVLLPSAVGAKRTGVPLVWHVREVPGPTQWIANRQVATIQKLADAIVVNSRYVGEALGNTPKVNVVHNALDLSKYQVDELVVRRQIRDELGISTDAPVVLMIGNVQDVKGHYLLVDAAQSIIKLRPDTTFVIVAGSVGPEYARSWKGRVKSVLRLPFDAMAQLKQRIDRLGISRQFLFTGFRQDIPEIVTAADIVVVLPQAPEGFGRPLIEAMAAGKPVVATDIGPTREILGDQTGILIPAGDADALASALVTLIGDVAQREQLGRAGRERVAHHFTMESHVAQVTSIYQKVLKEYGV